MQFREDHQGKISLPLCPGTQVPGSLQRTVLISREMQDYLRQGTKNGPKGIFVCAVPQLLAEHCKCPPPSHVFFLSWNRFFFTDTFSILLYFIDLSAWSIYLKHSVCCPVWDLIVNIILDWKSIPCLFSSGFESGFFFKSTKNLNSHAVCITTVRHFLGLLKTIAHTSFFEASITKIHFFKWLQF